MSLWSVLPFLCFMTYWRTEARALLLSGKRSTTEPRPQAPQKCSRIPRSKALGAWLSGRVLAGIFSSSFTSTEEGKRLR